MNPNTVSLRTVQGLRGCSPLLANSLALNSNVCSYCIVTCVECHIVGYNNTWHYNGGRNVYITYWTNHNTYLQTKLYVFYLVWYPIRSLNKLNLIQLQLFKLLPKWWLLKTSLIFHTVQFVLVIWRLRWY